MQTVAVARDTVTPLVPGGNGGLAHLSDAELLSNTRSLVAKSNQGFAALLAHLAEVEARGLHRTRACSSLYTYCIYELRFSEDAAARRAGAAKLVRRFPLLLESIASGELHLTGLLMLGPHLTAENVLDVLARAKFRTKKELIKLVRELHPLPLVPDSIEPLGLEPPRTAKLSWERFAASLAPAVRELPAGERPCDWANDIALDTEERHGDSANDVSQSAGGSRASVLPAPARVEESVPVPPSAALSPLAALPPCAAPQSFAAQPPLAPQQYQMQFSTTEEHVLLVERAKALLAREATGKSLGELHLQAMKLLLRELEKQKFDVTDRPRVPKPAAAAIHAESLPRSRHVPAATRRLVFERDGGRCTFTDEHGHRCRETHRLELHHRQPFAKWGAHTATNLTLHCPAHNALAAERDFSVEHLARKRESLRHASLSAQEPAARAVGRRSTPRS